MAPNRVPKFHQERTPLSRRPDEVAVHFAIAVVEPTPVNWRYRPKLVTRSSIILARSKGRIAWLQRKVLVAIGAVAATIPIVTFQQAPVSRQSRVPRVGHVREQPQHQREGQ